MKISLNFLDRWELGIFRKYNENHQPISAFVGLTAIIGAVAFVVVFFILQAANAKSIEYVPPLITLVAFGITVWKTFRPLVALSTLGAKIGYGAYILLFFAVTTIIFFFLSVFLIIVFCVFLILRFMVPSMANLSFSMPDFTGKGHIKDGYIGGSEGTEVDMELIDERIGEKIYRDKKTGKVYKQTV